MTGSTVEWRELVPARDHGQLRNGLDSVLTWLRTALPAVIGTDVIQISPVAYQARPFSHVVELRIATGAGERRLFLKIFKTTGSDADVDRMRRRIVQDFDRTREIHRALAEWPDLGVVNPVAYDLEHLATVSEAAPGRPLLEHLQVQARRLTRVADDQLAAPMERIGRWLRAFQSTSPSQDDISLDALRAYVDVRLVKLTALTSADFDEHQRRRVLAFIDRVGRDVEPGDLRQVPIHGDLAPGNVLVAPDRVTVLDFAMVGSGCRVHDLSRLCLQIDLIGLKPQMRRAVLTQATDVLIRAFDGTLTRERPIFRLLSMLHRVNHFLTLSTYPGQFPARLYNWHIRRHHRSSIARELRGSEMEMAATG